MLDKLTGVYSGIVEDNRDPNRLGRVKVRVPIAYGTASQVSTAQLPWAISRGLPAGGSKKSGGIDWLPDPGDLVFVTFLDGEPEKPLWEWATQSTSQAEKAPVHAYSADNTPKRAAMTRYGHTVELNASSVLLVTANGNAILLDDGVDGALIRVNNDIQLSAKDVTGIVNSFILNAADQVVFQVSKGFAVQASDMACSITGDLIQQVGRYTLFSGSALISVIDGAVTLVDSAGSTLALDGAGNVALTSATGAYVSLTPTQVNVQTPDGTAITLGPDGVNITAQNVVINGGNIALGATARTPIVLTDLLLTAFNSHTHSNGDNGSPTGPPIVPLVPQDIGSTTTLAI
jgi:hypothetical protein